MGKVVGAAVGEAVGEGAAVLVQGVGLMATDGRGELVCVELPHAETSAASAAPARTRRSEARDDGRSGDRSEPGPTGPP